MYLAFILRYLRVDIGHDHWGLVPYWMYLALIPRYLRVDIGHDHWDLGLPWWMYLTRRKTNKRRYLPRTKSNEKVNLIFLLMLRLRMCGTREDRRTKQFENKNKHKTLFLSFFFLFFVLVFFSFRGFCI